MNLTREFYFTRFQLRPKLMGFPVALDIDISKVLVSLMSHVIVAVRPDRHPQGFSAS